MKNIILLFGLVVLMSSCSNDDSGGDISTDLIGEWQLIEANADPGDGSGTFQPVDSDKVVVFLSNGTVTSNGSICILSIDSNNPTSGTYSLSDSTISSSDCVADRDVEFEIVNSNLIMRYPCIEACEEKFTKIK